MMIHVNNAMH